MEVKLVGWTTYKKGMPDALSLDLSAEDRQHLAWACDKLVSEDIIKNKWKFSGEYHQNGKCGMPVMSIDGKEVVWMCSWREWGGLMADCWNDIEKSYKYDYMDFYMSGFGTGAADDVNACQEEHSIEVKSEDLI